LLSASPSPAPGPWGIPLDDFEALGELFGGVDGFAGAAVLVTAAGGLVFAGEEVELPEELPHPAAMTPVAASASRGSPRAGLNLLIMVIPVSSHESGWQRLHLRRRRIPANLPGRRYGKVCGPLGVAC
jgi:hypothetical protein